MSQRRFARAVAPITIVDVDEPQTSYQARDLSVGGVFLLTEEPWGLGSARCLAIEHKNSRVIAKGRVIRSDPTGVGLRFSDESEQFRSSIRNLLVELVYEGAKLGEHRRAQRFESAVPVLWLLGTAQYRSTFIDLSPTGCSIHAQRPPPVGTVIYVQLPIIKERNLVPVVEEVHGCRGTVVRCTADGFAVEFKGMVDGFRRAIRASDSVRANGKQ
ncbi:MAG: hypothetical protein A2289_15160 [Deltaproteobacteria bacterium RIFOXYA12_FULL_58_15]|nr:MAG: hypothetical protein A2289_15160 [Deltaproteobacteria bacterium RIFOXYA12_FULL_58_15]OGR13778.1 MAG: hypothetical protein A2341_01045 [Deltaproteobacteria bacterium RIFOXYB12_FULL_58_9]